MSSRASAPEPGSARQRLVDAAIEQIEKHGMARLTVREVAAAAGANIAAVNYYFGSKEALVEAALDHTIRHMLDDAREILRNVDTDPRSVFADLFEYWIEGALRYPRVSKANLHAAFSDGDYSGPFPTLFAPVLLEIRATLQRHVTGLDERAAGRRAIAALSGVFFPSFFAELYRPLSVFETPRERRAYIDDLVRQLLAPCEAVKPARRKRR